MACPHDAEGGCGMAPTAAVTTPAFYRLASVLRITALSRATLYRRIAQGRFPRPVHLGGRACGWSHAAVQDWIADPEGYAARQEEGVAAPPRGGSFVSPESAT